jgi:hypothetical protein
MKFIVKHTGKAAVAVAILTLSGVATYAGTAVHPTDALRRPASPGVMRHTAPGQIERGDAPAPAPRAAPAKRAKAAPRPAAVSYSIPPNARAGECYVQLLVPAQYETVTEKVVTKEASSRIETVPPVYEWAEERVLAKEASSRLEIVPAKYKTVTEKILVKPASARIVEVPAQYDWVEEKVLVKPAHTVWKKGSGSLEKLDNVTGDIVCLVEVPAEYRTVRRRVVTKPATTRKEVIPAEYKEVTKTVMAAAPATRTVSIPAEYATVTRQVLRKATATEWRQIVCETNITPQIVSDMQGALKRTGHYKGAVNGQINAPTLDALSAFQRSKGMATGGITINALKALGVKY